VDIEFISLLRGLLEYNPHKRLSAEQALNHPVFNKVKSNLEIKKTPQELPFFEFEFEKFDLDKSILKELILDEVLIYRSSKARKMYFSMLKTRPNGMLESIYVR